MDCSTGDDHQDGPCADGSPVSRRAMLAGVGLGAGLVVAPTAFAAAAPGRTTSKTIRGHLEPGAADFVYVPVEVPRGVRSMTVSYTYDTPSVPAGTPGNSCDIGIFDQRGIGAGAHGSRGWSGGFRTEFTISNSHATPGYVPGPVGHGTWHVALGPYQVAPQGMDWTVTVTLEHGAPGPAYRPHYPPLRAAGRGRSWYRGDCHLHTVYSDGKYRPADIASAARSRGLDFIVSTDHNTATSHGVWGPLAGDDLLIITGEEVTTRNGHWLALGLRPGQLIDWRYRSRDDRLAAAARAVRRDGGLCASAHLYCPWIGAEWKFGFDDLDATEVWTGPWGWDDEAAVSTWANLLTDFAHGRRRTWPTALGNSDAHAPGNVVGLPHNVVRADDLGRDAILAGIRRGHNWIAESSSVQLSLVATAEGRTAGIGERLIARRTTPVSVRARVSGVPHGTVRLLTDEGQLLQSSLSGSGTGTVTWQTTTQAAALVRAEVRHPKPDGSAGGPTMDPGFGFGPMAALTNPIWLEQRGR